MQCAEPAALTPEIAQQFALESLRAYLEQENIVAGHFGADGTAEAARPAEQHATAAVEFDVGEFSYYEKRADADDQCDDLIYAPAHVSVRIGDGLLSFEADGALRQERTEPSAYFYADTDLGAATGSYTPRLDLARIHIGVIEVALQAAPGHLRGDITPAVVYFRDEAQLRRHQEGAWADFESRPVLFRLRFPDDACLAYELPYARNEAIERLNRQSVDTWRARAVDVIGATTVIGAVWSDGRETEVAVDLGPPGVDAACLGESYYPAPASELALRIKLAGRLRSADGRLDVPLDSLVVGIDGGAVVRATLWSRLPFAPLSDTQRDALGTNADVLLARLSYDLAREGAAVDGLVELLVHTTPTSNTRVGCLAFPPGGEADTGTCRYRR